MKRFLASILTVAVVCAIAWLFGFDFDKRGVNAGFLAVLAIYCGGAVYIFPGWKE
jgi:hypothetical protein